MRAPAPIRCGLAVAVMTGIVLGGATESAAQRTRLPVRMPRVEVGGGIGWVGQYEVGTRDATFTGNQPGAEPDPVTLFRVSGRTRSGLVGSGWVGVNLNNAWGVEGVFHYSQPSLGANVFEDVEGAPDVTLVASSYTQMLVEGNLLYHFNRARFDGDHTVPFVLIGAGSLRQKNDEVGIDETGQIYQAGVGFKWTAIVDPRRRARGIGVRLDLRYVLRQGGVDFSDDDERQSFIAASAATTFSF
jgi:hypothetical protein